MGMKIVSIVSLAIDRRDDSGRSVENTLQLISPLLRSIDQDTVTFNTASDEHMDESSS